MITFTNGRFSVTCRPTAFMLTWVWVCVGGGGRGRASMAGKLRGKKVRPSSVCKRNDPDFGQCIFAMDLFLLPFLFVYGTFDTAKNSRRCSALTAKRSATPIPHSPLSAPRRPSEQLLLHPEEGKAFAKDELALSKRLC